MLCGSPCYDCLNGHIGNKNMINFKFISKFNIIFDKLNYLFIKTLFCNTI